MVLRLWCVKKLFDSVFYLCYCIRESKKKGQD